MRTKTHKCINVCMQYIDDEHNMLHTTARVGSEAAAQLHNNAFNSVIKENK